MLDFVELVITSTNGGMCITLSLDMRVGEILMPEQHQSYVGEELLVAAP